jgi:hypothetical protein
MMPDAAAAGAAAAAAGTEGAAPDSAPKLYPHDAQKRFPVVLTCPHCGHDTAAPGGGADAEGAGAGTEAGLVAAGAVAPNGATDGVGAGAGGGAATAGTP